MAESAHEDRDGIMTEVGRPCWWCRKPTKRRGIAWEQPTYAECEEPATEAWKAQFRTGITSDE